MEWLNEERNPTMLLKRAAHGELSGDNRPNLRTRTQATNSLGYAPFEGLHSRPACLPRWRVRCISLECGSRGDTTGRFLAIASCLEFTSHKWPGLRRGPP